MYQVELDLLCSDSFYLLQHYPELRSVLLGRRWSCKSFAESTLQQIQRCDWRWRSSLDVRGQFRVAQLDASVIPAPETTHTVACWTVHRLVPSTKEQVNTSVSTQEIWTSNMKTKNTILKGSKLSSRRAVNPKLLRLKIYPCKRIQVVLLPLLQPPDKPDPCAWCF